MKNLIKLREEKGLRQIDMSKIIGLSRQAYCSYENGNREPDITTLIKLADYFNVTVDYLIGRKNNYELAQTSEQVPTLTQFENELLALFRKMNIHAQNKLIGYAYALTH